MVKATIIIGSGSDPACAKAALENMAGRPITLRELIDGRNRLRATVLADDTPCEIAEYGCSFPPSEEP